MEWGGIDHLPTGVEMAHVVAEGKWTQIQTIARRAASFVLTSSAAPKPT